MAGAKIIPITKWVVMVFQPMLYELPNAHVLEIACQSFYLSSIIENKEHSLRMRRADFVFALDPFYLKPSLIYLEARKTR